MLDRWASFVLRHRRGVLIGSLVSVLAAIVLIVAVGGSLSTTGFVDKKSESSQVDATLATDFGRSSEQLIFIFDAKQPVTDPAVEKAVTASLVPVGSDPRVAQLLTVWSTGNKLLISSDGKSTYAVAQLNVEDDKAVDAMNDLVPQVRSVAEANGLTLSVTGTPAISDDISRLVGEGIAKAESVSIPLTILIELIVFGTLIAAGMPLLVGGFAIAGAVALTFLVAHVSPQSIFAVNIITMLGLALGVDYSLFMISRYREELRMRNPDDALATTISTTGKAILFSGITVMVGLAATFFFPLPALRSMGLAGMFAVGLALIYGMTFLPALMAILGPRVNAINVRFWRRGRGVAAAEIDDSTSPFWHAIAVGVMRRPVAVLIPVLAILLLAGAPFLRLSLTPGGPDVLPKSAPSRVANDRLSTVFPAGEADPIPVLVRLPGGNVLSSEGIQTLQSVVASLAAVPNVTRVDSALDDTHLEVLDLTNPATLPTAASRAIAQDVNGSTALVEVVTDLQGTDQEHLVRELRGVDTGSAEMQVGGFAAASVDTVDGIKSGLLPAAAFVMITTYLILLLTFGSVFLPLKAIAMTLLSISASLGALVVVFQKGHGANFLGFTASGQIISTTPLLMFCILFGLSMDYEVLMLTRIQEEYQRTGDNTASVAFGLERTAKTITSAAGIMMVTFGAFMLADIVVIKSLGFGLTLGVLIDATIVRGLLVPATMILMGRWNWWAPRPIHALVDRLGFGHAETGRGAAVSPSAAD